MRKHLCGDISRGYLSESPLSLAPQPGAAGGSLSYQMILSPRILPNVVVTAIVRAGGGCMLARIGQLE